MRIAMITPHFTPAVRGNAVTVRRIERNLSAINCDVRVFSLDSMCAEEIYEGIKRFSPDLIHAFHGYQGGRVARLAGAGTGCPYIVTFTGTDLYAIPEGYRKSELDEVVRHAASLVVFDGSMDKLLRVQYPEAAARLVTIPQGVSLPGTLRGEEEPATGENIFFLPAGVRPVKNVLFPLPPLSRLHQQDSSVRFVLAGPILDPVYASAVLETLDRYPFARYIGEFDHDTMWPLYRQALVILNTSHFEGGMANSILEAFAAGRPVLASAIEGNCSLVREGETGFLYKTEEEFLQKALELLRDPTLCRRLGEQGKRFVMQNFTAEKECAAYLQLYLKITNKERLATASSPP